MNPHETKTALNTEDLAELESAKELLENPGLAAKITGLIGLPIEKGFDLLPDSLRSNIGQVTRIALEKAADTAIFTMRERTTGGFSSNLAHKFAVAVSGGVGGFFGLPALAVELPVTTTIMMRSVADIARSRGESLGEISTKLACIEVFALGGPTSRDDAVDTGYYSVRAALAHTFAEAAEFIAEKGLSREGAPALVRLIGKIGERFSIQVSEKIAGQAVPVIGAAAGAAINTMFMDHFQQMAQGHFTVRRLERKYGAGAVEEAYGIV